MTQQLVTVEFVAGFEGIGKKVSHKDGYPRGGWLYQCDGMPTPRGCNREVVVPRRYARVGVKPSGWVVCYGLNDDDTEDKDFVLVFCPSCAETVAKQ